MTAPALVTIPKVEIAKVGEDWPASTGPVTFTTADLQSAVAAQDDPGLRTPVLKLGHTDPRFDGEPCYGKIENMSLTEDGVLVGDIVGVPANLADVIKVAYPSRSLEGYFDLKSETGRTHDFAITGLALLGATPPAIESLADVAAAYGVALAAEPNYQGRAVEVRMGSVALSGTQVEDVRRAYYESLDASQMWWWIRAMYVEPPELIVDDDEGSLFRVGYTLGSDGVTFSDPTPVEIEYVDKAAVAASGSRHRDIAVSFSSRDQSRPVNLAGESNAEEAPGMTPEQKALIGLPADATDEQVNARLAEVGQSAPVTESEPPAGDGTEAPPATEPVVEASSVQVPEGMSLIDNATLESLRQGAQAGQQALARQRAEDEERILEGAIKAGKFPRARKAHFAGLLKADPQGTRQTIEALAPGLIPVEEIGNSLPSDAVNASGGAQYPTSWFPEVAHRQAGQSGSKIHQEG